MHKPAALLVFLAIILGGASSVAADGQNASSDFVLFNDRNSDWSPDGEKIVFTAPNYLSYAGRTSLYIADPSYKNIRLLTIEQKTSDAFPAWSPDGSKILFTRATTISDERIDTRLALLDIASGAIRLLPGTGLSDYNGQWSPDGSKIVFEAREITWPGVHIYIMNADSSNATRVSRPPTDDIYSYYRPEWAPDRKKIAFATASGIVVINADGTGYDLFEGTRSPVGLIWTSDGKQIIFSRFIAETDGIEFYRINADGTGLEQLPEDGRSSYPLLPRPDSDVVINYARLNEIAGDAERREAELEKLNVQFVDPIPEELLNRKVAYVGGGGSSEIYIINLDGSGKKHLTEDAFNDYNPDWSPDGTKIAFMSSRDTVNTTFQIYYGRRWCEHQEIDK